ncbi:MAG: peptide chain release factor 1 [Vulcanimicrobiota bacterium]
MATSVINETRLEEVVGRYAELTERLGDPQLLSDAKAYKQVAVERAGLEELAQKAKSYLDSKAQLVQNKVDLRAEADASMAELYKEEISSLSELLETLSEEIRVLLLPKDPYADKNIIVEIRPAAGGDEAGIFAGDLFRMYSRYAESKGWRVSIMDAQPTGLNGYKEMVFEIQGTAVYRHLKYESGVHRVQRVPETESQGRVHTSTVTVAVLPEADEVDEIQVEMKDIKVDTYRASGAGGQHVNKTDSAVRLTHLPSGVVVACQDERSQHQNRDKAMRILKAKLLDMERRRQEEEYAADRKSQVGTGDRSEKIRTYNYPQSRVTDHRIGLSVKNLSAVMDGDLEPFSQALQAHEQQELLAAEGH